jgi:enoyl-CoA hydratase/carnithine racemase
MTPGPTGLPFPLHDIAVRLAQSSVISIASVRGRARGSGAEFIVSCDMSFASREKAILGHWEVGASAVPGAGGIERLSALVGRSRALEIIIGCEDFDADDFHLWVSVLSVPESHKVRESRLIWQFTLFGQEKLCYNVLAYLV